jgi:hypothetical protein
VRRALGIATIAGLVALTGGGIALIGYVEIGWLVSALAIVTVFVCMLTFVVLKFSSTPSQDEGKLPPK